MYDIRVRRFCVSLQRKIAFFLAIDEGHVPLAETLIAAKADVNGRKVVDMLALTVLLIYVVVILSLQIVLVLLSLSINRV